MTQEVGEKRPDTSFAAIAKSFSVKTGTPLSPFICSTVDDFQNEHSILHEKVFPQLAELCSLRKTHFSPIDLGWYCGSKRQASSFRVLSLNLDYVTKCAPFFLCLLGERYGSFRDPTLPQLSPSSLSLDVDEETDEEQSWLDRNLLFAASSGYKWVLNDVDQYLSLTELTIRHAVFSTDDIDLSPASASQHFSFFYFRQPDHLELLNLEHLSPDERSRELALYESESELATSCVEGLKLKIVKKGLTVRYFSTAQELAAFALNDWKSVIDFLYPPIDSKALKCRWFSEEIELNTFSATCRQFFVHTNKLDAILNKLTAFVLDRIVKFKSAGISLTKRSAAKQIVTHIFRTASERMRCGDREESLLLLVGSRGCGKSSLLATWTDSFRHASPPVKIFEHYAGCTENSTSAMAMMGRCIARLRSAKHYMPGTDYGLNVEDPEDYNGVREEFHAAISSEGCVLLLDNIDVLYRCAGDTTEQMVKDPKWLPFPLPPTVTVIASCTKADLAYHSLVNRPDVRVVSFPGVEDTRSRQAMLVKNTQLNGTIIDRGDRRLVIGGSLAGRPLYLALLGGEMRVFVASERMLNCMRCCSEALSICDLWGHVVRRWMDEYSWSAGGQTGTEYSGWIPDTLRLISTSRNGLLQTELLAILSEFGFTGPKRISSFDWLRFRLAASNVLVETSAGLIRFMHGLVREATDFVLFGCITPLSGYRRVEKTAFKDSASETLGCCSSSKLTYHRHLANYFVKQPFGVRQVDELPWQFNKLQDYEMLAKFISDQRVFMDMYGKGSKSHRASEILGYWRTLMKSGFDAGLTYRDLLSRMYSEYEAVEDTSFLDHKLKPSCFTQDFCKLSICIGRLLIQLGCHADARDVLMGGILCLNKVMPLSETHLILLSRLQALIGSVFVRSGDGGQPEAVMWHEEAIATIESRLNNVLSDKQRRNLLEAKGCLLLCLGDVRTKEGDLLEAEALFNSARLCMLKSRNVLGGALVLNSIGILQMLQNEFKHSGESLRSALLTLESYHGKSHPTVAGIYSQLGTLAAQAENVGGFSISKAQDYYRTALKLNEECLGPCHVRVANDLFSLGILLWSNGKSSQKEEAHEMIERAFDICTLSLGEDHSLTRRIRAALASQEIERTLQLQAPHKENTVLTQRQRFLPNTGKRKVRFKRQMSLAKPSEKPTHLLPSIRTFAEYGSQSSLLETCEASEIDSQVTLPDKVGRVPQNPGSAGLSDDSLVVELSQDLDEQTRYTPEKSNRSSVRSATTYQTYHAAEAPQRHKSPAEGTRSEEMQKSTHRQCVSTGAHRHISCFKCYEDFPRSITSGPYAAINSLLNTKQFSLPTPGSLH